ncbi:3'-5' exonuclease family protein [Burkholderia cepacia]|uniref:3'-5' exoribonuclease n=1 Tax=Burkholderia cepacia TaxID=292 RepID=UPI001CF1DD0C|nr:3'-5' exoribonuclease [Burkholderia cepacia]MCA7893458.1 3'-5' exoribonuclease [Burkholderia cepacia]
MPFHVFVDTEFTDFIDCDLISIALVAQDGREFYGERSDFDRSSCSEFVRAAVLPQLGQFPEQVYSREALRCALLAWLSQLESEPPPRMLCFDYGGDWELLVDLLGDVPSSWLACRLGEEALDVHRVEMYFKQYGGRHHALFDARANCYAAQGRL